MKAKTHIPDTLDEVISEIASVLAQGYLRLRKSQRLASDSGHEAEVVAKNGEFGALKEK